MLRPCLTSSKGQGIQKANVLYHMDEKLSLLFPQIDVIALLVFYSPTLLREKVCLLQHSFVYVFLIAYKYSIRTDKHFTDQEL